MPTWWKEGNANLFPLLWFRANFDQLSILKGLDFEDVDGVSISASRDLTKWYQESRERVQENKWNDRCGPDVYLGPADESYETRTGCFDPLANAYLAYLTSYQTVWVDIGKDIYELGFEASFEKHTGMTMQAFYDKFNAFLREGDPNDPPPEGFFLEGDLNKYVNFAALHDFPQMNLIETFDLNRGAPVWENGELVSWSASNLNLTTLPASIAKLSALTHLDLSGVYLTEGEIYELTNLLPSNGGALQFLHLPGNPESSSWDEELMQLFENELGDQFIVDPSNDIPTGELRLEGPAVLGGTLTVDISAIDDKNGLPEELSYQWYADDKVIEGATSQSYTLTESESGKSLQVGVFYKDNHGYVESLYSNKTNPHDVKFLEELKEQNPQMKEIKTLWKMVQENDTTGDLNTIYRLGDKGLNGYGNHWVSFLDSSVIDLTDASDNTTLSMVAKWALEDVKAGLGTDSFGIHISTDQGGTWNALVSDDLNYHFYETDSSLLNSNGFNQGWGGHQDWINLEFELKDYVGKEVMVRAAFGSNSSVSTVNDPLLTGVYIENIVVSDGDTPLFDAKQPVTPEQYEAYLDEYTFSDEQRYLIEIGVNKPGGSPVHEFVAATNVPYQAEKDFYEYQANLNEIIGAYPRYIMMVFTNDEHSGPVFDRLQEVGFMRYNPPTTIEELKAVKGCLEGAGMNKDPPDPYSICILDSEQHLLGREHFEWNGSLITSMGHEYFHHYQKRFWFDKDSNDGKKELAIPMWWVEGNAELFSVIWMKANFEKLSMFEGREYEDLSLNGQYLLRWYHNAHHW